MTRVLVCAALLAILGSIVALPTAAADEGFAPIFDGHTLDGWKGPDPSFWTIEDGAITGKITPEHKPTMNQYLVWNGGKLDDFELKLTHRIFGSPSINGGFQFRSEVLPDGDVKGYQVDNNHDTDWLVRLYDEHGRHDLALRGNRTLIGSDGKFTTTPIAEAAGPAKFKLDEWHQYDLICQGPTLTLKINGQLAAEVVDNDPNQNDFSGILALQLHTGEPMTVQFKDIQLRRLEPLGTPAH
jgi:hypothetical protein